MYSFSIVFSVVFLIRKASLKDSHKDRKTLPVYQTVFEVCVDFLCTGQTIIVYF